MAPHGETRQCLVHRRASAEVQQSLCGDRRALERARQLRKDLLGDTLGDASSTVS